MTDFQVALYARVSSEQQAEAKTIESQVAEIRVRIAADGYEQASVLEFVDEGYSGSTLGERMHPFFQPSLLAHISDAGMERGILH